MGAEYIGQRHLRYFCAVADQHGLNRAARALHLSQFSISAQICDLEDEIGVLPKTIPLLS